jgi:hypothetical protein
MFPDRLVSIPDSVFFSDYSFNKYPQQVLIQSHHPKYKGFKCDIKSNYFCFLTLRRKPDTLITHPYSLILLHLLLLIKRCEFLLILRK